MVFIPGANSANRSLPKYDWPAPAAMIRLSMGVRSCGPSRAETINVPFGSIA